MQSASEHRFSISDLPSFPFSGWDGPALGRALESELGLRRLEALVDGAAGRGAEGDFLARTLENLGVSDRLPEEDFLGIPRTGPVVVVANRPSSAVEGLLLGAILRTLRPDVRFLADHRLARIPDVRGALLFVDPFGRREPVARDRAPLRQAIRWVEKGGLLVLLAAGEVAFSRAESEETTWSPPVALILRWTEARAVPAYFAGPNGPLFRIVGGIQRRLRTALLPPESLGGSGRTFDVRAGAPVPVEELEGMAEAR
ncbi:MAG TPA: hypothetical protein VFI25_02695 [Planctomycetota bacterium]|nr:hypothetical protein [Planctomycetota bacterium]